MKAILLDSVQDFISATKLYFAQFPVQTNFLSTISQAVLTGNRKFERCYWWIITTSLAEEETLLQGNDHIFQNMEGKVIGAAMRAFPSGYILSPMSEQATMVLARAISEMDDNFPYVVSESATLLAFQKAYLSLGSPGSLRTSKPLESELMYEVKTLLPHSCKDAESMISGRVATMDDFTLIRDWMIEFSKETGMMQTLNMDNYTKSMIENGRLKLLILTQQDNKVVSFANCQGLVGDAECGGVYGRVGPVYTPPEYRGRGYASAVTHSLSQDIIDDGATPVLLTDAHNSTSNALYQRLGYQVVCEDLRWTFDP